MFSGITFGQFIPGDSLLHRLDPRTKIACVLIAAVCTLVVSNGPGFVLVAGFTLGAILLSRLHIRIFLGGLRSLWVLLAITFIVQALLTPGDIVLELGIIKVTREGLTAGGQIFLRLALLILLASLLTLTTSPVNLTAGLESLLSPLKRVRAPVHELAMMMTIALRFVPILLQEAEILIKAQRSRGAGLSGGPAGWVKGLLPLFVPLFAGALRRAEELAVAMDARCYRGGANRTRMSSLKFGCRDFMVLGVTMAVLAAVFALKYSSPERIML